MTNRRMQGLFLRGNALLLSALFVSLLLVGKSWSQDWPAAPEPVVESLLKAIQGNGPEDLDDVLFQIDEAQLGPDGKPIIPILLTLLDGNDSTDDFWGSRDEQIIQLITTFGIEGLEPLGKLLLNERRDYRAMGAYGLGRLGPSAEGMVDSLVSLVKEDSEAEVRRNAVWALGRIKAHQELIVVTLAEALDDEDRWVVIEACETLRRLGDQSQACLPQLAATVDKYERAFRTGAISEDDELRLASLNAYALLESESAIALPFLMRLLRLNASYSCYDDEQPVSMHSTRYDDSTDLAAARLQSLKEEAASAGPLLVELHRNWLIGLSGEDRAKFGPVFDDKDDFTIDESFQSLQILATIGDPVRDLVRVRLLPFFESDLISTSPRKRVSAAGSILRFFPEHRAAWDEIVGLLSSKDAVEGGGLGSQRDLRVEAAACVAQVEWVDPRAIETLLSLLEGTPSAARLQAARTVGKLKPEHPKWRPAMIDCLKDYYRSRRAKESVWDDELLHDVDTDQAIAEAHLMLGEDSRPFHDGYVGILGWFSLGSPMAPKQDPRNMQRVLELGTSIVPALVEDIEEKLPADRWYDYNGFYATRALGLIGAEAQDAVEPICSVALRSENPALRREAAIALGRIGQDSETAVPALIAALDDPWASVRAAAAQSLASFGADALPAKDRLVELSKSSLLSVRRPALSSLEKIDAEK